MPRRRRGHRNGYHHQQDKIRDTTHIAQHGAPAGAGAGVAAAATATSTATSTSTATASLIKPDCDTGSDLMDQLPDELQMAVEDATSCPVCLDVFVNPVVHSCGHSLCRRCHEALTIDKVMRFQCPVCRAPLVAKPPLNFSLQALTEIMRASAMQQARKDLAQWRRTTNSRQQLKRSTHNHNAHHQWQRRAAAAVAAAQPAPLALEPPRGVVMQPPRLQPGYFHGPKVDSWRYYVDIVPRRIITLLVITLIVVGVVLLAKLHAYYLPVPPALTRAYAEAWHRVTSSVGELLTT